MCLVVLLNIEEPSKYKLDPSNIPSQPERVERWRQGPHTSYRRTSSWIFRFRTCTSCNYQHNGGRERRDRARPCSTATGEAASGAETDEDPRPRAAAGMEDRLDAGSHGPAAQVLGQDRGEQGSSTMSCMAGASCQTQADKSAGVTQTADAASACCSPSSC